MPPPPKPGTGVLSWFTRDLCSLSTFVVAGLAFAFSLALFIYVMVTRNDAVHCHDVPALSAQINALQDQIGNLTESVEDVAGAVDDVTGAVEDVASTVEDLTVSVNAQAGCQGFNQASLPMTITVGGTYCALGPMTWTTVGVFAITVQTCDPVTIDFRNQQFTTAGEQTIVRTSVAACVRQLTVKNIDAVAATRRTAYQNAVIAVTNTSLTLINARSRGFGGVAGVFGGSLFARNIDFESVGPIASSVGPDAFATTAILAFGESDVANVNIRIGPDDPLSYGSQGFYVGPNYWSRFSDAGYKHKWRNVNVVAQSWAYVIAASDFDAANVNVETNAYGVAAVFGLGVRVTHATNAALSNFNITVCPDCAFSEGIITFGVNKFSLTNGVISGPITANCFPTSLCPVIPAPVATALLHVVPGRPASPAPQLEPVDIQVQNVDLIVTNGAAAAPLIIEPAGLLTGIPPPGFSYAHNNGNIKDDGFGAYVDSSTSGVRLSNVNFVGGHYGFYAGNGVSNEVVTHSSFANTCTALRVGYSPSSLEFSFNSGTNVGTATEFLDGLTGITYNNNNIAGPGPVCGTAPDPLLTYYALIGGSKRGDVDTDSLLRQFEEKFAPPAIGSGGGPVHKE